jgi:Tfp pilus assembly protein PilX
LRSTTRHNSTAQLYGAAAGFPATLVPSLKEDPRYTVEDLGFVKDSLVEGQEPPEGRDFFQVSSHSTGATGLAGTVLQSTYARRF